MGRENAARLDALEVWQLRQNGTLQTLNTEVKEIRKEMNQGFSDLKDLYYDGRDEANKGRSSNSKQTVTWILSICAILVSLSGVISNFLRK
jgi:uncharacterized coiled-coil protein SlyX